MYEEKTVLLDFDKIFKQNRGYNRRYGLYTFRGKVQGKDVLKLRIVSDSEAQFINLFGVCMDIKTGNIALGLFPNPNEYVLCGNLYSDLSELWFGSKVFYKKLDMRYIVQLLKLDPVYYQDEIIKEICFNLDYDTQDKDIKSICVRYMRKFRRVGKFKEQDKFLNISRDGDFIAKTAKVCINIYQKFESLAQGYFQNFITEQYTEDIRKSDNKSLEICYSEKRPNLEALTSRYVELGFPLVYLVALKSYGFSIKDRKSLFNRGDAYLSKYSTSEIEDIAVALSSSFYSRNVAKRELILAYNFMDLARSIGWDHSIYFALDLIVESGSKNMWQSLVNHFNIPDILREQKLSMREFVLGIDTYRRLVSDRIDWGTCYNRVAYSQQYKMLCYASGQIEKAGRVFESAMSVLNKSLQIRREG